MIGDITPDHYPAILEMNAEFVHWLAPLDQAGLDHMLEKATYARQIDDCGGVLFAYGHDADYSHKNIEWLSTRFDQFLYIDRIIISADAQGKGLGKTLYSDLVRFARLRGYPRLVCEVNTKPDNPGSHKFHEKFGFVAIEDVDYPSFDATLRYYEKLLGRDV